MEAISLNGQPEVSGQIRRIGRKRVRRQFVRRQKVEVHAHSAGVMDSTVTGTEGRALEDDLRMNIGINKR